MSATSRRTRRRIARGAADCLRARAEPRRKGRFWAFSITQNSYRNGIFVTIYAECVVSSRVGLEVKDGQKANARPLVSQRPRPLLSPRRKCRSAITRKVRWSLGILSGSRRSGGGEY